MTLHAAITETLLQDRGHHDWCWPEGPCSCGRDAEARREAEWVLAVLADRLPHTPPDQLATLIGGTVLPDVTDDGKPALYVESQTWPLPDSPPAAPKPRQET